jgi:hypothetical protein
LASSISRAKVSEKADSSCEHAGSSCEMNENHCGWNRMKSGKVAENSIRGKGEKGAELWVNLF